MTPRHIPPFAHHELSIARDAQKAMRDAEAAFCEAIARAYEAGASWRAMEEALGIHFTTLRYNALKARPNGWNHAVVVTPKALA